MAWLCTGLNKLKKGHGDHGGSTANDWHNNRHAHKEWQGHGEWRSHRGWQGRNNRGLTTEDDQILRRRIGWLNKNGGFNNEIQYRPIAEAAAENGDVEAL